MAMKKFILLSLLLSFLYACGGGSSGPAPSANLAGFVTESISGSDAELAIKKDGTGNLLEEGVIRGGTKDGIYMTYHPDNRIKTLGSYVGGKLNGIYMELSNREQIDYKAHYLNDQLHGKSVRYKFGRPTQEITYNKGVIDGPFVEYSDRGKMTKKGSFKNGKQHGTLQFFDDEENLIMEYEYENGEKVSGGIIE